MASFDELEPDRVGDALAAFASYAAYLDSFVSAADRQFLESEELARQLIEAGINPKTNLLSEEEFLRYRQRAERLRALQGRPPPRVLCKSLPAAALAQDPFLLALAQREEDIVNDKLSVVLFLRARLPGPRAAEASAYIDLGDRLAAEDFSDYYLGRRVLLPRPSDLSYFNWTTGKCCFNDSANFKAQASPRRLALAFVHRKTKKTVRVDGGGASEERLAATEVPSRLPGYLQVLLYDCRAGRR